MFEAMTGQTTLFRRLDVRVVYEAPEPVVVTDFSVQTDRNTPGESVPTQVSLVNVTDEAVVVNAVMRVVDVYGQELVRSTDGPFTVEAGSTSELAPVFQAPSEEGSFSVHLELERDTSIVARADSSVQVLAGSIEEFTVPASIWPGQSVEFSVTYANYTSATKTCSVQSRRARPGRTPRGRSG